MRENGICEGMAWGQLPLLVERVDGAFSSGGDPVPTSQRRPQMRPTTGRGRAETGARRAMPGIRAGRTACAGRYLGDRGRSAVAEAPDLAFVHESSALRACTCDTLSTAVSARFIQAFAEIRPVPDTNGSRMSPQRTAMAPRIGRIRRAAA